ncbi:MAG: hypothetical protein ABI668_06710 [Sphingorhabdus sp.]
MNPTATSNKLVRALQPIMPDATFAISQCRDWYSMTFSGAQIVITAQLQGTDAAALASQFVQMLPEHEFVLPRLIVADIAVVSQQMSDYGICLEIEALVLDE